MTTYEQWRDQYLNPTGDADTAHINQMQAILAMYAIEKQREEDAQP